MTNPTQQRLTDIQLRHERATKGEWRVEKRHASDMICSYVDGEFDHHIANVHPIQSGWGDGPFDFIMAENAEFMAAAHTDIPWLISRITELEAALKEAENAGLERAAKWHEEQASTATGKAEMVQPGVAQSILRGQAQNHCGCAQSIRALKKEKTT